MTISRYIKICEKALGVLRKISFMVQSVFDCACAKSKIRKKTKDWFWRILNKSIIQKRRVIECFEQVDFQTN